MAKVRFTIFVALIALGGIFPRLASAEMTSHLSSSSQPPYSLKLKTDLSLLALGIGTSIWGSVRYHDMEPRSELPAKSELLLWDRPFAGNHNRNADKVSDWMRLAILLPFAWEGYNWATDKSDGEEVATFLVTAVEIGLLQNGLNLLVRSFRLWPRPELYADADKDRGEAWGSFYSGHASAAFSLAVFSGMWFEEKNPESPWVPVVWSVSLSSATLVGVLRIWAGKHYPTDVVAGAFVGSLTSFAVLKLHETERVSLTALPGYIGFSVRF